MMTEPILTIPQKRYKEETTIVSMRVPKDMLRELDEVAAITGRTRNEIITTSLEFALRHTQIAINDRGENQ